MVDQHLGRGPEPARQRLEDLVPHVVVGILLGAFLKILPDPIPQRVQRLELAHFLGEVVVERQQLLAPHALDRRVVVDRRAGQLLHLVLRRVGDGERSRLTGGRAGQLCVESGRVGFRAELERDVLHDLGLVVRPAGRSLAGNLDQSGAARPRQIQEQRVAGPGRPILHRMPPGGALPELLEGPIDGADFEHRRRLPQREPGVVARIDRREGLEVRDERERAALLEHHIFDVRRRHRLQAALPEGVSDQLGNQVVGDVIQDLLPVTLLHHRGGHFTRPEPGDPGSARVTLRHAVDFGVEDVGGNFEREVLAGIGDFGELGLHPILIMSEA